jgi:hypothetical protein
MRTIKRTARFKRDYKREAKGRHRQYLDRELLAVITCWRPMLNFRKVTATTH